MPQGVDLAKQHFGQNGSSSAHILVIGSTLESRLDVGQLDHLHEEGHTLTSSQLGRTKKSGLLVQLGELIFT